MIENDNKPGEDSAGVKPNGAIPAPSNAFTGQPDDLHDLFGADPTLTDEEDPLAALRKDPNYAALISELEYIASQARLLFEPAENSPSDEVWTKIQSKLAEESTEPEA